jgi:hypothetical protein
MVIGLQDREVSDNAHFVWNSKAGNPRTGWTKSHTFTLPSWLPFRPIDGLVGSKRLGSAVGPRHSGKVRLGTM